ncbi:MAG: DUF6781 family protein [Planctomycetota bacterium]
MQSDDIKRSIGDVIRSGGDVRAEARRIVEWAAESASDTAADAQRRVSETVNATIEGASAAVDRSTPDAADSTLRQVIDGIGEGLGRSAQATKLAVEEAASNGRAFAEGDLKSFAEDLRSIGELFVETVERHASSALGQASDQANALKDHAERTIGGVRPAIEDAARAAASDPAGLAGDAAQAAASVTREAAGSLFSAVGKLLGEAGDRIKPEDRTNNS